MCLSCKTKCGWKWPIYINRRTIGIWFRQPIKATRSIIEMGCGHFWEFTG